MLKKLYSHVDLTLLKATAGKDDYKKLCETAIQYETASVCVPSNQIKYVASLLSGSNVAVCTVVGFPLGNSSSQVKAFEAQMAISNGATEIDMVADIGAILDENWTSVSEDIATVKRVIESSPKHIILKVIVETCYIDAMHVVKMCEICESLGVDYIKTSTGFGSAGADLPTIHLMKQTIDNGSYRLKIKASGGIRKIEDAKMFIDAGADRIGTSGLN